MDPFSTQLNEMLVNTYRSVLAIEQAMLSSFSGDSLSISEMHTIEAVGDAGPDGRTITDIAMALNISPPSVTMMVKRLEKKGFVFKARGEKDGRCIFVRLTELGRRADISHRYFHRQMVRAVGRSIPEEEKDALLHGLTALNLFFHKRALELTSKSPDGGAKS
jgi:DNA-binding MarR family transcriptional regulator